MDASDVNAADPELRDRISRRIVNNNESILKIDCALSELPRFEHHNHNDDYWMGSVLIADSVNHVEFAHSECMMGKIPDENASMFLAVPTMLDPSLAPPGKHTLWIEYFAPYQIAGAEGTGLHGTGWTEELKNQVCDRVLDKLADYTLFSIFTKAVIRTIVMLYRDLMICLRETASCLVLKPPFSPKHPEECFLNPPCECANPGKELQCESCPHLEACLSPFQTRRVLASPIKRQIK